MNYFGGKRRIGAQIAAVLLRYADSPTQTYLEPMCGMCSVMRHVPHEVTLDDGQRASRLRLGNDLHADVVALWRAAQSGWRPPPDEQVTDALHLALKHEYKRCLRADGSIDAALSTLERAALRAYVGYGCSWSAIYYQRFDPVKVPRARRALLAALPHLADVQFTCSPYDSLQPRDCLVYMDPPYRAGNGAINHYRGTPRRFDQERFWQVARDWSRHNVVLVSERVAPPDFVSVWSRQCTRRFKPAGWAERNGSPACAVDSEHLWMHRSLYERKHRALAADIQAVSPARPRRKCARYR